MYRIIIALFLCSLFSCTRMANPAHEKSVDVVLIGGGIMSATLGSLLETLDSKLTFEIFEELPQVAMESSAAWNNAGTGHAGYCELNYTTVDPQGNVDINKAVAINEAFELSKEFWAYQVEQNALPDPHLFINKVPHMSFVWGDDNIAFLKKRYEALVKNPLFSMMIYSEDPKLISSWIPLVMAGRNAQQKVAATRVERGTDVDFGVLTRSLFNDMVKSGKTQLHLKHTVTGIEQLPDQRWKIAVKDLNNNERRFVIAKFVFIGGGGGTLPLLQKANIPESDGFGGFPVGGQWLVTDREDLIERHDAKVYGKASVGSPPMSVPHLDTRFIDGKKALLFGPFATFSTRFLKYGSWTALFSSINVSNIVPIMQVAIRNFDLTKYLINQVLLKPDERLASLREYFPDAELKDWTLKTAGQRVQIIKDDPSKGGILQFGTELVHSHDRTLQALLGASPGASTAVEAMLRVIEESFPDRMKSSDWKIKLAQMVPTYGYKLSDNIELLRRVRAWDEKVLKLTE